VKIHGLYVPGKGYLRTAVGTATTKIVVIAGEGSSAVFRDAFALAAFYGGQPENWQKMRGEVILVCEGKNKRAEVHWAQEESVGYVEEKFRGWLT